jgi:polar amino acid transport system substrate-binding protein
MLQRFPIFISSKRPLFITLVFVLLSRIAGSQTANRDLEASLAILPGLADTPDQGTFVELVKAMDDVYPGKIRISVYPYARSFNNVISGIADFHIPALRNPSIPDANLGYRYVAEKMGSVHMVLYSRADKILTRQDIMKALEAGGPFPYMIEVSAGAEANCAFPARPTNNFEQSLLKLDSKRIDAIWNAQEETDLILKRLKRKNIHRSYWGTFDDVIVVHKGPRGDEVDQILSELLRKLKASGRLESIHRKAHLPYIDWQPADMNW